MDPDWDDFKVLLALARTGSVAGAARELKVDNSTVSRRLAAIEGALGSPLLIRGGREFAWTAEGRTALEAAEQAEKAILAAVQALTLARSSEVGTVRLATTPATMAYLEPVLAAHRGSHPGLKFEYIASFGRVDLARGEADIALRFGETVEPDLVARHVLEVGWAVYAAKASLPLPGCGNPVALFPTRTLILYAEPLHRYGPGLRWLEQFRRDDTAVTRVDNLQIAEQLIGLGRGIGMLPCHVADPNATLGRVIPEPVVFHPGYLVYHASRRDVARIRAALEVLTEVLSARIEVFSGRSARRGAPGTAGAPGAAAAPAAPCT